MAATDSRRTIRIGGASGYWGDADMAVPQLLAAGDIDYLVFDYLAEITMSILARARKRSPDAGYASHADEQEHTGPIYIPTIVE